MLERITDLLIRSTATGATIALLVKARRVALLRYAIPCRAPIHKSCTINWRASLLHTYPRNVICMVQLTQI